MPPLPKAYWRRIHVIQMSTATRITAAIVNSVPSTAMWNTLNDSTASTAAMSVSPPKR